jgi:hypothetical protein
MQGNWREEFGAEYAVPAAVLERFEDMSWKNDTCPAFFEPGAERVLFVEHPDPLMREYEGVPRFAVVESYGGEPIVETDSLEEALAAMEGCAECARSRGPRGAHDCRCGG